MKRTTRILALVLMLCLLFSTTAFAQAPVNAHSFPDVSVISDDYPNPGLPIPIWFARYVQSAYDRDWVTGIRDPATGIYYFRPNAYLTRAQAVAILARMANAELEEQTYRPFPDVPAGNWAAPYVAWARGIENNIVEGRNVGGVRLFFPNERITRQEFALMMMRFTYAIWEVDTSEFGENEQWDSFTDLNAVGGWARESLRWANSWYITIGSGNRIMPRSHTTRAQATAIIVRMAVTFEPTD